jgi:hypothetical protein
MEILRRYLALNIEVKMRNLCEQGNLMCAQPVQLVPRSNVVSTC